MIALALSAMVVAAALATADLGALAVARAQAQTAADMAALAAVTPAGGASAVGRASQIAAANGAEMTRCACQPMEAVISVRRRVLLPPLGVPVEVTAHARAVLPGPAPRILARPSHGEAGRAAGGRWFVGARGQRLPGEMEPGGVEPGGVEPGGTGREGGDG